MENRGLRTQCHIANSCSSFSLIFYEIFTRFFFLAERLKYTGIEANNQDVESLVWFSSIFSKKRERSRFRGEGRICGSLMRCQLHEIVGISMIRDSLKLARLKIEDPRGIRCLSTNDSQCNAGSLCQKFDGLWRPRKRQISTSVPSFSIFRRFRNVSRRNDISNKFYTSKILI